MLHLTWNQVPVRKLYVILPSSQVQRILGVNLVFFLSWEFVCFDNVIYAWNWEIEGERESELERNTDKTRIQFVWCFRRNRGKKNKFDIWANKIANTYLTTMLALVEHNYIFFTIFVISHRLINVLINKRWFNGYVIWSVVVGCIFMHGWFSSLIVCVAFVTAKWLFFFCSFDWDIL